MKCADCPFSYAWGGCHFDRDYLSPCELSQLAKPGSSERVRFVVYEVFEDGPMYELHTFPDWLSARSWANTHRECTPALYKGKAKLMVMLEIAISQGGARCIEHFYEI